MTFSVNIYRYINGTQDTRRSFKQTDNAMVKNEKDKHKKGG